MNGTDIYIFIGGVGLFILGLLLYINYHIQRIQNHISDISNVRTETVNIIHDEHRDFRRLNHLEIMMMSHRMSEALHRGCSTSNLNKLQALSLISLYEVINQMNEFDKRLTEHKEQTRKYSYGSSIIHPSIKPEENI